MAIAILGLVIGGGQQPGVTERDLDAPVVQQREPVTQPAAPFSALPNSTQRNRNPIAAFWFILPGS